MQKQRTYFEQVPLAAIRKIVDEEIAKSANKAAGEPARRTMDGDFVPAAGDDRPEQDDSSSDAFLR